MAALVRKSSYLQVLLVGNDTWHKTIKMLWRFAVYGCPDWFIAFTANPKWKEITESLENKPGQQPCDRSDVIVRVYKIKLDEMLDDIRDGTAFGTAVASSLHVL